MGIVEHGAGERDHVGLAFGDDRLCLLGSGDQPDGPGGDGRLAPDLLGKLNVGVGGDRRPPYVLLSLLMLEVWLRTVVPRAIASYVST